MKNYILISCSFLLIGLTQCVQNKAMSNGDEVSTTKKSERDPQLIYEQLCSSCHGNKVEAFVDRKWKHGKEKSNIIASITNGYTDDGMPSWKAALTEGEINALADLIVQSLNTVTQYNFKDEPKKDIYEIDGMTLKLVPVAEGLDVPWGMTVLPEGGFLVSDRSGKLYKVDQRKNKTEIANVPLARIKGQGGLLDIELHPNYKSNKLIYLSYSKLKKEGGKDLGTTAIIRAKLEGSALTNVEEIFEALPYSSKTQHYGSRLQFDKSGFLYFSVGDRGSRDVNPQNLDNHCGKIHRLNDDGSIPSDNPFVDQEGAMPSIYSFGHRNPQGIAMHPETGLIWETEHGPRGGDEVNIVEKGKNFGWPVISYGINYDGTTFTSLTAKEGMVQPQIYWLPSIAPSGLDFVTSDKYPAWKGDLLAGSLRFKYVNRCHIKDSKITEESKVLINIGRTRDVVQGSDGYLYVSVENPGTVYRIEPI